MRKINVLFFDTESSDLHASWGRILCASFAINDGEVYTFRGDTPPYKGRNRIDDSKLVMACRSEIEKADIVVGWNSILHDIPLLNARLAKAGEAPIRVGEKYTTWNLDLMYYAGGQSNKIGGRSLDRVSRFLECRYEKTPLDGDVWQLAATGDKSSLDKIQEHCEADVDVLREVAQRLFPYVKKFQLTLSEVWPFIYDIPSRKNVPV